ncbi:MAG: cytochrome P450 [Verrucomicrobiales bacterium]|nr:cytochrome P450 [Verrucomicrobiales bacterium]
MSDEDQKMTDPFREARRDKGVLQCPFQGETLPMVLRHADVRETAKDWKTFSSDAPFRVPIPSEEDVRSMRQLPIETNPPEHGEYRKLVEPFFKRSKTPEVTEKVTTLIDALLSKAIERESIEVVREFALPLQSRALTYLLNVPEAEADTWIKWGIHVFRDGDSKGGELEVYLNNQFDKAEANPGDDFFSALTRATFQERSLTREEMMGFANLTFAGGRDTVIQSVACALAYLGEYPETLEYLREDPKRIIHASEEMFRVFMPLPHIGRVCPEATDVMGVPVPPGGRVSLCWSSANFDETVFDKPEEIKLDRKPNPHLSFGFGTHLCLGAPHARLIMRTLLEQCSQKLGKISILNCEKHIENEAEYQRANGYTTLEVKFEALQ